MNSLRNVCRILGEWRSVQKDVTAGDVDIVFNICCKDKLTVKQLVLNGASSRSTTLRRLRDLVGRGLVTLQPHADDGRAKRLALTAKGTRWASRLADRLKTVAIAFAEASK